MRKTGKQQRRADAVYVPSPVSTHLHWQIGKDCLGIRVIHCVIQLVPLFATFWGILKPLEVLNCLSFLKRPW